MSLGGTGQKSRGVGHIRPPESGSDLDEASLEAPSILGSNYVVVIRSKGNSAIDRRRGQLGFCCCDICALFDVNQHIGDAVSQRLFDTADELDDLRKFIRRNARVLDLK
ncbi:hypothetical protein VUN82_09930 [Micrococcaceae bacterium Sec5.1]